jgi:hypothetical protein
MEVFFSMSVLLQAVTTAPDIGYLAGLGLGAVIVVMLVAVTAQVGLSYLGQRNLNDQLSLGMQAVVGANNIRVVDEQQDDGRAGGRNGGNGGN